MTQTIEQLTARVRDLETQLAANNPLLDEAANRIDELEEENARLNGVIESNIDDGIDKIMAMSDEQVSALAGFEGSNPEDKTTIARQYMDIAMLRVDLAALKAENEWQPIETAPKDGTEFLTYCQSYANKWWISTGKYNLNGATHWMPLPKPPALDAAMAQGEK